MSPAAEPARLDDAELVARFILSTRWVRADGTVKQDAYMPPRSLELSVSRHRDRTQADLWLRGSAVAAATEKRLVGRADISATRVRAAGPLDVVEAPLPDDPGHAHIIGWPAEKSSQKMLAMRLAAAARFAPTPLAGDASG